MAYRHNCPPSVGRCPRRDPGGAAANLVDRAADGVVTDYLHSSWWPTFNLADTFIVLGAITASHCPS